MDNGGNKSIATRHAFSLTQRHTTSSNPSPSVSGKSALANHKPAKDLSSGRYSNGNRSTHQPISMKSGDGENDRVSASSSATSFEALSQIKFMDESASSGSPASSPDRETAPASIATASPTTTATLTPTQSASPHGPSSPPNRPFSYLSDLTMTMPTLLHLEAADAIFTDGICNLARSEETLATDLEVNEIAPLPPPHLDAGSGDAPVNRPPVLLRHQMVNNMPPASPVSRCHSDISRPELDPLYIPMSLAGSPTGRYSWHYSNNRQQQQSMETGGQGSLQASRQMDAYYPNDMEGLCDTSSSHYLHHHHDFQHHHLHPSRDDNGSSPRNSFLSTSSPTEYLLDNDLLQPSVPNQSPYNSHEASPEPPCSPHSDHHLGNPDDLSDTESLAESVYHQPPKAADRGAAQRLAKRLFHLEGFKITDVAKHLCKRIPFVHERNDFSQLVGEEYAGFFSFESERLDLALRTFLSKFTLTGETQERERILHHFSRRYITCNPNLYNSEDACHTLVCALMLLNTDLHGQNVTRKMTSHDFIANLAELNNGDNFDREELKSLYNSIKTDPIHWPHDDQLAGIVNMSKPSISEATKRLLGATINPFLDIPSEQNAKEYMRGFVLRKSVMECFGKKTGIGKRGWKMFYARLRDTILYLHKDAESAAAAAKAEDVALASLAYQMTSSLPHSNTVPPPALPSDVPTTPSEDLSRVQPPTSASNDEVACADDPPAPSLAPPGSPAPDMHRPKQVFLVGAMTSLPEQQHQRLPPPHPLPEQQHQRLPPPHPHDQLSIVTNGNDTPDSSSLSSDPPIVTSSDSSTSSAASPTPVPVEVPTSSAMTSSSSSHRDPVDSIGDTSIDPANDAPSSPPLYPSALLPSIPPSPSSTLPRHGSLPQVPQTPQAECIIRVAHSISFRATDYTKKQNVFRLKTKDGAEYLFQTSDPKEVELWVDNLNFVAALLSAPPMASGVGSEKSFYRPLLPSSYTPHNIKEQLENHQKRYIEMDRELKEHMKNTPKKGSKAKLKQEYEEKMKYLEEEIKRYKLYARVLEAELVQMQNVFASQVMCLPPHQQQAVFMLHTQSSSGLGLPFPPPGVPQYPPGHYPQGGYMAPPLLYHPQYYPPNHQQPQLQMSQQQLQLQQQQLQAPGVNPNQIVNYSPQQQQQQAQQQQQSGQAIGGTNNCAISEQIEPNDATIATLPSNSPSKSVVVATNGGQESNSYLQHIHHRPTVGVEEGKFYEIL